MVKKKNDFRHHVPEIGTTSCCIFCPIDSVVNLYRATISQLLLLTRVHRCAVDTRAPHKKYLGTGNRYQVPHCPPCWLFLLYCVWSRGFRRLDDFNECCNGSLRTNKVKTNVAMNFTVWTFQHQTQRTLHSMSWVIQQKRSNKLKLTLPCPWTITSCTTWIINIPRKHWLRLVCYSSSSISQQSAMVSNKVEKTFHSQLNRQSFQAANHPRSVTNCSVQCSMINDSFFASAINQHLNHPNP